MIEFDGKEYRPLTTMIEIRQRNKARGGTWFSVNNMRFCASRVGDTCYPVEATGGAYFVSSERDGGSARRYTVRYADVSGDIHSASDFGEYASHAGAQRSAQKLRDVTERDYAVSRILATLYSPHAVYGLRSLVIDPA